MNKTVFEYLYRDAGNYKVYGIVPICGEVTKDAERSIKNSLIGGDYFFAEKVGIPTLYQELWKYSDGPTDDDHEYHEYIGFRSLNDYEAEVLAEPIEISDLVSRFMEAAKSRRF